MRELNARSAATGWDDAPPPVLVVEVISPTTRRRDLTDKRDFYLRAGVTVYRVIDPDTRNVRIIRARHEDIVTLDALTWHRMVRRIR